MARKQVSIGFPFPYKGLAEIGAFETQRPGTTAKTKNVRSFAWVDNAGTPERGRMSGGQRPGISPYHSPADRIFSVGDRAGGFSIQDMNSVTAVTLIPVVGGNEVVVRETPSGGNDKIATTPLVGTNATLVYDDTDTLNGALPDGELLVMSVFDREGNFYTASTAANNIHIRKFSKTLDTNSDGIDDAWEEVDIYSETNAASGGTFIVHGMAAYGRYIYILVSHSGETERTILSRLKKSDLTVDNIGGDSLSGPTNGWVRTNNDNPLLQGGEGFAFDEAETGRNDSKLAISRGIICMVSRQDSGDHDIVVTLKSVLSGENIVAPTVLTTVGSAATVVYGVVGDARGNFWFVANLGDTVSLFNVDRDGAVTQYNTATSANAGRSIDYDLKNDRVLVVGADNLLGLGAGTSFAMWHAHKKEVDFFQPFPTSTETSGETAESATTIVVDDISNFNVGDVIKVTNSAETDTTGTATISGFTPATPSITCSAITPASGVFADNSTVQVVTTKHIRGKKDQPFDDGDAVTLTTVGTLPDGLATGTTYYVRDLNQGSDGLWSFRLSTNRDTAQSNSADIEAGTSNSLHTIIRAKGARVGSSETHGTTANIYVGMRPEGQVDYNCVRARTNGGAVFLRPGTPGQQATLSPTNLLSNSDTAGSISDILNTLDPGKGAGINCVSDLEFEERVASRQIVTVVTANGSVKRLTSTGFSDIEGGDFVLATDAPVIFSQALGNRIFYVDGINSKYYDAGVSEAANVGEMFDWDVDKYTHDEVEFLGLTNVTEGRSKGYFPTDSLGNKPRLICAWRQRIVLSGLPGDPHNFFMSRSGDPYDFDYLVQPEGDKDAGVGTGPTGLVPDKVNALIPYSDDILLFGCDHSIYQLSGDPAQGGRFDLVSDTVGMAWGRAFCQDPEGRIFFFGSRGGVYAIVPGQKPAKITTSTIDERLVGVDLDKNLVTLEWNDREQGVHVFISPMDPAASTEHYFYDSKARAWWVDSFESVDEIHGDILPHNALSFLTLDGDDANDRVLLLGGREGRIYKWDIASQDDYVGLMPRPMDSFVYLGPLNSKDGKKLVLTETAGILAANSHSIRYDVYVGRTAEEIIADTGTTRIRWTGEFSAGRDRVDRRRAIAGDIFIKLKVKEVSTTTDGVFSAGVRVITVSGDEANFEVGDVVLLIHATNFATFEELTIASGGINTAAKTLTFTTDLVKSYVDNSRVEVIKHNWALERLVLSIGEAGGKTNRTLETGKLGDD